jgi:uncharacterized membrane protein YobD (UPF0266 family)
MIVVVVFFFAFYFSRQSTTTSFCLTCMAAVSFFGFVIRVFTVADGTFATISSTNGSFLVFPTVG